MSATENPNDGRTRSVDLPRDAANPVLVEVTRGSVVESQHRGSVAVVDVAGEIALQWGDVDTPVLPRSAIKAIQALPLVESGAADAFDISEAELAIACASHNGEPRHVAAVRGWLDRMGLSEGDLECGAHWPRNHQATLHDMIRAGEQPGPAHNNCSGKHTGMLATALHLGETLAGYVAPTHGVQRRILGTLEALCGLDLGDAPRGTDGCSAPTWAIPLNNLALAFARIGAPEDSLPPERAAAATRIRKAVAAHPELVAGTGRYCTAMMTAAGEKIFVKTGAEGVFCAALPEYGLGVALKCDDGAPRAAQMMLTAVLRRIGVLDDALAARLDALVTVPIENWNGRVVGAVRPSNELEFQA
jgi:L-asparaginase II